MPHTRSATNEEEGDHLEKQNETGRNQTREKIAQLATDNYEKCLKWSYEMNKGIYQLYLTANPRQIGYQRRLKALWDEKYLVYNNLTVKHLAEHVRNIKRTN